MHEPIPDQVLTVRRPVLAIAAGGQSTRMGFDKSAIVVRGETLLARTARCGRDAGLTVAIIGHDRPNGWPSIPAQFIRDEIPGHGPLSALAAALTSFAGESILLTACDMPLLTARTLLWLVDAASRNPSAAAVATVTGAGIEPLFSVYRPQSLSTCTDFLQQSRSARSLLGAVGAARVEAPPWIARRLLNVNTPEELARLCASG